MCLALFSATGCDCRSDTEVANQVFEQAAAVSPPERVPTSGPDTPWDVHPVDSASDPCAGSPGQLVVTTAPGAIMDLQAFDERLYWSGSSLYSHDASGLAGEPRGPGMQARGRLVQPFAVSESGLFTVTRSQEGPARTRLSFLGADGRIVNRVFQRDDVLLNDVLPVDEGAYLLAGRKLDSAGGASQLLHYSTVNDRERVVLEIERGAFYLTGDETDLYWIEYPQTGRGQTGNSAIVAYAPETGERRVLFEGPGSFAALAVGERYLYWVQSDTITQGNGRLMRVAKTGGRAEMVHASVGRRTVFAQDDAVFAQLWDASDEDATERRLYRVDAQTHQGTLVLEDPVSLGYLRLEDGVLYWATRPPGDGAPTVRCLRSLRLPE